MTGEGHADRPGRRHDLWDEDETKGAAAEDERPGTRRARRERGAHGRPRRKAPSWVIATAGVLVLLLCAGGGVVAFGGEDEDAACGGEPITVAAAPEISDALQTALDEVKKQDECAEFDVSSTDAAAAAKNINGGKAPDVWIPDSSTWLDAVDEEETDGRWVQGQSIASSPVALAVGSEQKGAPSSFASWGTLLREDGGLRMANPDVDTASRLAFHASRIGEPDRIGLETGKRLIFMSRFAAPSSNKMLADYTSDQTKTDPFPASEQQIAAYNDDHEDIAPLRSLIPKKGSLTLDYPWITNPELDGAALETADRARTELGTVEIREALTEAGFRGPDGGGGPTIDGQEAPDFTELEALSSTERVEAVEQWDTLRTDMRMLALIDVSGSMRWDSPTPGTSRWDVTEGALAQGIDILPDGSRVGAWVFSTDRGGNKDHESIADIERLDETSGSQTHRERLREETEDAEKYIEGDTALYDSIWASYQKMAEEHDSEYVNSVVVFTDGENDDPNGGLELEQLLDRLDSAYDSDKPVRIITIGMGEADASALQQISDETGGTSYIAETPDDIERVFVQALLARN